MPVIAAKPNASATASGDTAVGHPCHNVTPRATPNPTAIPMPPPNRLNTTASTRNCRSTSRPRAPIAIRNPISRVRSVTDTSMMFMIPMPPTSSDTPAMLASRAVIVCVASFRTLAISSIVLTMKSSGSPG